MKDTDSDWAAIAATQPYFGVLTDPAYLRENLTPEALDAFWASGRQDLGWQIDLLRAHYGVFEPEVALDFGCGVGRLTRVMAKVATSVFGVDVAPAMLEVARQDAPSNITYTDHIPDAALDWVNSTIVFQHIHPSRGVRIIADLVGKLKPGGAITLHVTTGRDVSAFHPALDGTEVVRWNGEDYRPLISTPPVGGMTMYDYDLGQVMIILNRAGIHRVTAQYTNHADHHGVILIGRKG